MMLLEALCLHQLLGKKSCYNVQTVPLSQWAVARWATAGRCTPKLSDLADGSARDRAWLHRGDVMTSVIQGNTKKEDREWPLLPPLLKLYQLIMLIQKKKKKKGWNYIRKKWIWCSCWAVCNHFLRLGLWFVCTYALATFLETVLNQTVYSWVGTSQKRIRWNWDLL